MTDVSILAGTLVANREERTVTGLLLPYGEEGRTNLGRLTIDAGTITIPRDPIVIGLDVEHDREQPVGRALATRDTPEGIVATFKVADTPEGDRVLDEVDSGTRRSLSAEIADVVIRAGKAVAGRLFGAAVCETGAFPSAAIYAKDTPDETPANVAGDGKEGEMPEPTEAATLEAEAVTVTTDATVVQSVSDGETVETVTESAHDEVTYESAPAEEEPAPAPAETVEAEAAEAAPESKEEEATVPETLTASVPAGSLAARKTQPIHRAGASTIYASLAAAFRDGGKQTLLAALADVTTTNIVGAQPEYLGELWSGRAYRRRIIPLFNQAELRTRKLTGWRWTTNPVVAAYSGDKTAVPSATIATEEVELAAERLAVGHDIDRIFADFGEQEFFDAYFRAVNESYAKVSDDAVFTDILTAAGAASTVGTVPTGVGRGWAMVVDGALEVISNTNEAPTFALVNSDLYRDMLLTRNDDVLPLLSAALGFEEGDIFAQFKLMPWADVPAGQVLVGTKPAVTVHELGGGTPIRVDALDLVNGGVDHAAFGYYVTNVHDASGLVLVDDGIA